MDLRKNKVQQEAVKAWKSSQKGTIVMATGSGKTRVGVLIANEYSRTLVVTPTTQLRDREWVREFELWSTGNNHVDIVCVQSVYSNLEAYQDYDLIILDEVHSMLSPEYSRVFSLPHKARLCLTATPPINEEYAKLLQTWAPIVFELSLEEAVDQGLISSYKIVNIPISLTRGERFLYSKFNSQFLISKFNLMKSNKTNLSLLDYANSIKNTGTTEGNWAKRLWVAMGMRKNICYKSRNKIFKALDLLMAASEESKWIIFSVSIAPIEHLKELLDANGVSNAIYHSKLTEVEKEANVAQMGDVKVILSAMAFNAGFNLPTLDGGLCLSGTSSSLTFIQQIGRVLRKTDDPNKQGLFINFYNKATVEEEWLKSKLGTRESSEVVFEKLLKDVTKTNV